MEPDLKFMMSKWLAALFRSYHQWLPEFAGADRIAEYLENGPTVHIATDEACTAALLELAERNNALAALGKDFPTINLPGGRLS